MFEKWVHEKEEAMDSGRPTHGLFDSEVLAYLEQHPNRFFFLSFS